MNSYKLHYPLAMDDNTKNIMANAYGTLLREREQGISGYYNLPQDSLLLTQELQKEHPFDDFDRIAVIGIGGSSLGTKAIHSFLGPKREHLPLYFLENPDPVELRKIFEKLDKKYTLFLVISKSGTTIETISIFKAVIKYFGLELKGNKHIAVITDIDSPLHKFAEEFGLKSFAIPKNVGGRFSVLSSVGIVPLTLAGFDTPKILQGAKGMIERFFALEEEHILQKAAFIAQNWPTYRMNVLFSYANELEDFNKWYVQLWGESLGKKDPFGKNVGPTPIGHIGPVDQHSFLQLIIEGPRDKTVSFLCIENFEETLSIPDLSLPYLEKTDFVNKVSFARLVDEECKATMRSVRSQKIPVDSIVVPSFCEEGIGELIAYYELLTSATGAMLGITTYDQPGVELGKKILKERFRQ